MYQMVRPAAWAAFSIFLAFFIHNVNALYVEPRILGFENPAVDYAKVNLLRNASGSLAWTLSGFGHLFSGFAAIVLGFATYQWFVKDRPVAVRLALGAATVSGAGFMLTGIADVMGGQALKLLATHNPEQIDAIYLAGSVMRITFNGLAIVALGWFAIQLSWCGLKTGWLSKAFCYFGFFAGVSGLMLAVVFVPVYLQLYLVWSLWLAISLWRTKQGTD